MLEPVRPGSSPVGNESICTLFEGDYHLGLAAFVNSLFRAGYVGPVWAGYRGALPPWLDQLERGAEAGTYLVGDKIKLTFLPIETDLHFTNYKPRFMLDLLTGPARDCSYLWYFDPDIFLRCGWSFFAKWQQHGIALCQEIVNNILPPDSPLRHQWMGVGESIGLSSPRLLNHYFNAGMVGVSPAYASFLRLWERLIEAGQAHGGNAKLLGIGTRDSPFTVLDQDALNIAIMYTEHPLTTMGPEAMGFAPSGFTTYHAVGPKPWRANFLLRALAAVPPSPADKFFFTQVSSPIRVYSSFQLRFKLLTCSIAALIGRFYHRT